MIPTIVLLQFKELVLNSINLERKCSSLKLQLIYPHRQASDETLASTSLFLIDGGGNSGLSSEVAHDCYRGGSLDYTVVLHDGTSLESFATHSLVLTIRTPSSGSQLGEAIASTPVFNLKQSLSVASLNKVGSFVETVMRLQLQSCIQTGSQSSMELSCTCSLLVLAAMVEHVPSDCAIGSQTQASSGESSRASSPIPTGEDSDWQTIYEQKGAEIGAEIASERSGVRFGQQKLQVKAPSATFLTDAEGAAGLSSIQDEDDGAGFGYGDVYSADDDSDNDPIVYPTADNVTPSSSNPALKSRSQMEEVDTPTSRDEVSSDQVTTSDSISAGDVAGDKSDKHSRRKTFTFTHNDALRERLTIGLGHQTNSDDGTEWSNGHEIDHRYHQHHSLGSNSMTGHSEFKYSHSPREHVISTNIPSSSNSHPADRRRSSVSSSSQHSHSHHRNGISPYFPADYHDHHDAHHHRASLTENLYNALSPAHKPGSILSIGRRVVPTNLRKKKSDLRLVSSAPVSPITASSQSLAHLLFSPVSDAMPPHEISTHRPAGERSKRLTRDSATRIHMIRTPTANPPPATANHHSGNMQYGEGETEAAAWVRTMFRLAAKELRELRQDNKHLHNQVLALQDTVRQQELRHAQQLQAAQQDCRHWKEAALAASSAASAIAAPVLMAAPTESDAAHTTASATPAQSSAQHTLRPAARDWWQRVQQERRLVHTAAQTDDDWTPAGPSLMHRKNSEDADFTVASLMQDYALGSEHQADGAVERVLQDLLMYKHLVLQLQEELAQQEASAQKSTARYVSEVSTLQESLRLVQSQQRQQVSHWRDTLNELSRQMMLSSAEPQQPSTAVRSTFSLLPTAPASLQQYVYNPFQPLYQQPQQPQPQPPQPQQPQQPQPQQEHHLPLQPSQTQVHSQSQSQSQSQAQLLPKLSQSRSRSLSDHHRPTHHPVVLTAVPVSEAIDESPPPTPPPPPQTSPPAAKRAVGFLGLF